MPPPYREALEAAIAAAREAGDLLRTELRLEGGARGCGSHAHADIEAERMIRARLLAVLPCRYLGEETGWSDGDPAAPIWIVDPNDGTASFLEGYRGSSVSIALLDHGVPVLGVVNAYAYPDDDGELFAWAEGCGPITCNGVPIDAHDLSRATLDRAAVIFVSQAADENAAANARCVLPARFAPLASVAHRLARVAAGEGIAAVCLSGCASWDVAAGHALLRASGGTVIDEQGVELQYDREGRASMVWCFAGARPALDELRTRPWRSVRERSKKNPVELSLSWPTRGRGCGDSPRLRRAQGCLLGQLIGEALGAQVEFMSVDAIAVKWPTGVRVMRDGGTHGTLAGQATDDSELALLLARTLVRDGRFDRDAVRDEYVGWLSTNPFDVGNTTRAALVGNPMPASEANGALMRVSPLGIMASGRPELGASLAREDASITHPNPFCVDASAAFVAAIAVGIATGDPKAAFAAACAHARTAEIRDVLERARDAPPEDFFTHQGWVRIALGNAFFQLAKVGATRSVEEAMVDTVMRGGDTDTNAAIAGALLGAVFGRDAFPFALRQAVLTCRPLPEAKARHVRPMALWGVDALALAEALLLVPSKDTKDGV